MQDHSSRWHQAPPSSRRSPAARRALVFLGILLKGHCDLGEHEATRRIYCKGKIQVDGADLGTVAAYREVTTSPAAARPPLEKVHVRTYNPELFNVLYSINGNQPTTLGARGEAIWDTRTLFVLHLPNGDVIHVPPPKSGDLWLELFERQVQYVVGTPHIQAFRTPLPLPQLPDVLGGHRPQPEKSETKLIQHPGDAPRSLIEGAPSADQKGC